MWLTAAYSANAPFFANSPIFTGTPLSVDVVPYHECGGIFLSSGGESQSLQYSLQNLIWVFI
ncbi:hypothetical protein [Yersinia pseudotuberculosis]|uniref:hypothetical protein n=1 Tax=Yersinia pseudotuberculosis TaxID=633 RepID=UPI00092D1E07|nr:hypothetical protein [Yersinia pseudotuberculosis]AXY34655.1 hypothetical protein CEQ20_15475 [Yersinia pseudotuberculosis]AYX10317.1 hypothetical protein EGX52_05540 [Yersinia pseudotuberculosis]MBO1567698.1 hypothetical protein [Yersinia pseudotuberculosis]MBO1591057.1 hypothetical protein [Yersinia pseudotuberculosis]MBO1604557.1 hypothetical protein [Yersinia pseudotuberculosis]